jgi:hypothetical protein
MPGVVFDRATGFYDATLVVLIGRPPYRRQPL